MLKSTIIAIATLVISATASQAFEVCSPKLSTDVEFSKSSVDKKFGPEFGLGLDFVIGKANCDRLRAEAAQAKADAINAELEIVKTQRENEEQSLDNLIKMVKAFDALNELCEETSNKAICFKAEKLAIKIAKH